MIKLKAVAHPPDPLVPSLLPAGDHWIGWAGKSQSRQAIQKRIASDVKVYGLRGVTEVTLDVDLPSRRDGKRTTLADIEGGYPVLNLDRCTTELREHVATLAGIDIDQPGRDINKRTITSLKVLFSLPVLLKVDLILWSSMEEGVHTTFGALRDTSRVVNVEPQTPIAFTLDAD